jgi:hypothetical protein
MCMIGDDDGWAVFRSGERRAAKNHRCGECGRTIVKGERYRFATGLSTEWEAWSTFHLCGQCNAATRWLVVVCGGYLYEATREDIGEHVVGDEDYLRTAPLTRLYRWHLTCWRDRNGDLRPVEDVQALTTRAIDAHRRKFPKAVA